MHCEYYYDKNMIGFSMVVKTNGNIGCFILFCKL